MSSTDTDSGFEFHYRPGEVTAEPEAVPESSVVLGLLGLGTLGLI